MIYHPGQFIGLPPCELENADVILIPLPFEKTVSYGKGTSNAPSAIIDASVQLECFDHETNVDFEKRPLVYVAPPVYPKQNESVENYLDRIAKQCSMYKNKFPLALGGEHTVTYGMINALSSDFDKLTIVHVDAHADLIDVLEDQYWSHGTVMRRILDLGCKIFQVGIRSISKEEHVLATSHDRIAMFYAHDVHSRWTEILAKLRDIHGDVYLTFDVDAFDPSVIPSTGTPQPDGLNWRHAMELISTLCQSKSCNLIGADVVEFIPSPDPPGCDIIVSKLVYKILAHWYLAKSVKDL